MLPITSLLDVLKETDLLIGFSDHFKSVADRENLDRQSLQQRLLLCLYGMGTNTGLKRVSGGRHGISYIELQNVRRRFVHKAALRNAIGQVAGRFSLFVILPSVGLRNNILRFRLQKVWPLGSKSNDGMAYPVRWPWRHDVLECGKKTSCIYSQLKRYSSSQVAAMIEGVLRLCKDMDIEKQYVDNHGQSEAAFAFSYLLGFDLLPRLKAVASQNLYRTGDDKPDDYPNLESVLSPTINRKLII